jgi:hypothetical protein
MIDHNLDDPARVSFAAILDWVVKIGLGKAATLTKEPDNRHDDQD